jgi:hypothetical protein
MRKELTAKLRTVGLQLKCRGGNEFYIRNLTLSISFPESSFLFGKTTAKRSLSPLCQIQVQRPPHFYKYINNNRFGTTEEIREKF